MSIIKHFHSEMRAEFEPKKIAISTSSASRAKDVLILLLVLEICEKLHMKIRAGIRRFKNLKIYNQLLKWFSVLRVLNVFVSWKNKNSSNYMVKYIV